jgi:RNA polymerase sigma-70 factor (ECF subfamily)
MRPPTEPGAEHRPDEVEQALLERCQAGDQGAFQALLRPHLTALLGLARRCCRDQHWAEDLVQETLVRAFRGLANFRGDAALRTWLFTILVRLAGEPGRWRHDDAVESLGADVPDHLPAPAEDQAIQRELNDRLAEAMERLTARQRTALHLRAAEGLDYAAIGAVLGCTAVAARMHVLAARRHVLARLQEHLEP